KAIITGGDQLPNDLAQAATNSRFYLQYNPFRPLGLERANELPGTDMSNAFQLEVPSADLNAALPGALPGSQSALVAAATSPMTTNGAADGGVPTALLILLMAGAAAGITARIRGRGARVAQPT